MIGKASPKLREIRGDALYPAPVLRACMGLEKKSWASLKRAGLRTIQQGRYAYVLGSDVLALFKRLGEEQAGGAQEVNPR